MAVGLEEKRRAASSLSPQNLAPDLCVRQRQDHQLVMRLLFWDPLVCQTWHSLRFLWWRAVWPGLEKLSHLQLSTLGCGLLQAWDP